MAKQNIDDREIRKARAVRQRHGPVKVARRLRVGSPELQEAVQDRQPERSHIGAGTGATTLMQSPSDEELRPVGALEAAVPDVEAQTEALVEKCRRPARPSARSRPGEGGGTHDVPRPPCRAGSTPQDRATQGSQARQSRSGSSDFDMTEEKVKR